MSDVSQPPANAEEAGVPDDAWEMLRDGIDIRRTQTSVLQGLFGGSRDPIRIGRFEVTGTAGQGEMGRVYIARDPELGRDVAIKLIRARRTDPQERESRSTRLRVEAQALAKVQHPNVIAIHEVGRHDDDVFIVMEYIRGPSLRGWLAERSRSYKEIFPLLVGAGRGLAAAHEQGLVHRDFKPDNVLVAHGERAVVLDFGLVHAGEAEGILEGGLPDDLRIDDRLTRTGAVVGTPAYMAPEQMRGQGADPRSDQFAYCVTLFEALHGRRPFEAATAGELVAAVQRGELTPTRRLPGWLAQAIARGLKPEPEQRFASMDELLAILDRRPGSRRVVVAAGVGVVGVTTAVVMAFQPPAKTEPSCGAGEERIGAVWNGAKAQSLAEAFERSEVAYAPDLAPRVTAELDGWAADWSAIYDDACEATHVRLEQSEKLLDLRNACLNRRLAGLEAAVELLSAPDARVIERAGTIAGSLPDIEACANTELLLRGTALPDDPEQRARIEVATQTLARSNALFIAGRYDEAWPIVEQMLVDETVTAYPPTHAEALMQRAKLMYERGHQGVERTYLDAVAVAESHHLDDQAATIWRYLVEALSDETGDPERVAGYLERFEVAVNRIGRPALQRALLARSHGRRALIQSDPQRAAEYFEDALEVLETTREPTTISATRMDLGRVYWQRGKYEHAAQWWAKAEAGFAEVHGPEHPYTAGAMANRGAALVALGKHREAIDVLTRAYEIRLRVFGPGHRYVAVAANSLASAHYSLGDFAAALPLYEKAVRIDEATLGSEHPRLGPPLANVARTLSHLGRHEEAIEPARRAVAVVEKARGPEHVELVTLLTGLGHIYARAERYEDAASAQQRAIEIGIATQGEGHVQVAYARQSLALTLLELGRLPQALTEARFAEARLATAFEQEHPQHGVALSTLGRIEARLGKTGAAREHLQRALEVLERTEAAPDEVEAAKIALSELQ